MDLKDSENLIESIKKRPLRTILAIVVLLVVLFVIAFFNGFFGERGKRAAGSSKEGSRVEQPFKDSADKRKAEPRPTISQHTEGDQAPIVNVGPGGKSTINYGPPKDGGTQE
jgi:hypothetical protein